MAPRDLQPYGHYSLVDMKGWRWPNFRPFELRQRSDDNVYIVADFLDKVQELRTEVGFGLEVSSYYRSPEYNAKVSGTGRSGPHTTGRAIDLLVSGSRCHAVLTAAMDMGFTGIGLQQRGPHASRFIHLDMLNGPQRPWVWTYP